MFTTSFGEGKHCNLLRHRLRQWLVFGNVGDILYYKRVEAGGVSMATQETEARYIASYPLIKWRSIETKN